MKQALLLLATLLPSFATAGGDPSGIRSGGVSIGTLAREDLITGCGCTFSDSAAEDSTREHTILEWETGSPALMYIDHKPETLTVEGADQHHASEVGEAKQIGLVSKKVLGTLALKATFVCPRGTESCEVTKYEGTLHIRAGKRSARIPVNGECGC